MNNICKKIKITIFLIILLFVNLLPAFATIKPIDQIIKGGSDDMAKKAGYTRSAVNIVEMRAAYLKAILSFLGVVFLGLIIYGGFIWMLAKGDSEGVKKSKDIIINASIGLGVVLASYAISEYIISRLVGVAAG